MLDDGRPDRTCQHDTSVYERCWDCCPGEEELLPLDEGLLVQNALIREN